MPQMDCQIHKDDTSKPDVAICGFVCHWCVEIVLECSFHVAICQDTVTLAVIIIDGHGHGNEVLELKCMQNI